MRSLLIFLMVIVVIGGALSTCNTRANDHISFNPALDSLSKVKRGAYLVNAIGCDDCHSPKRMGLKGVEIIPELRFSGFQQNDQIPPVDSLAVRNGWSLFAPGLTAAVGPWGASFAGNITSDETGIGNWSEESFIRCIRKGKLKGMENGRDLLPPMPWFVYKNLSDDDLASIYAYLKTTKPVRNMVPAPRSLADLTK